jgi:anaerobic selenocysteine-containing dehydrogenase
MPDETPLEGDLGAAASRIPRSMSLDTGPKHRTAPWELAVAPSPDKWADWTELDPAAWPERVEKHYALIPTICFNCESACGLVAYVDKEKGSIAKFEGNPVHPGSRGRTCAKGPATINQIHDTERILKPLKRQGKRGSGEFVEVSWEEALDDIGGRIRKGTVDEHQRDANAGRRLVA